MPSMNQFSLVFQKSDENTTCEVYTEMSRLVKLYAANLLKVEAIVAAGNDLKTLSLVDENQLSDEQ